ncbi:uncharacterized protein BO66DRAFT_464466 [Aspergillus aculeatinus CBS 121060]|uniref:Uncharacterized protein n=1 Tax=Aspergillus aculeatinus CBS 121060 TaxID=1448322 RepID=A0ACD1HID9_9EURO|nr:hypothetical protein BO66DRAFT_464466 [Aspergillus aculeatinus CBS 121060]RAH73281.1 hypothetical protein BO66DRAFT_464466 [Aspergillus aculeatinus CBS 121060]
MRYKIWYAVLAGVGVNANTVTNNTQNDQGTFQNPGALIRPRFRYWLPDAGVNKTVVQENVISAASIGAGGVEFVPFYDYGGELAYGGPGPDWVKYGFGTEAFNEIFVAVLQAHKDHGLAMDFALGPSQGQGVPAHADDEGLQWDLAPFSTQIPSNGSFNGQVPGWGTGELVALVSANVLSAENISLDASAGLNSLTGGQSSYWKLMLRNDSLVDHADTVSSNGHVRLQFPYNSTYRLFAFYQTHTLNRNLIFSERNGSSIFDNGSYIVDHYSGRGAQTTTQFWENYILTPEVKQLLSEAGNYAWEDSIEATCNISWTPSLPSRFLKQHGYDLRPFLPLVMFENNNLIIQESSPGAYQCVLDTPDQGAGYLNDYRETLGAGYRQYLGTLTAWAESLGLQMSAQVSYNLPLDMEASIPEVNAPECESLEFGDSVDGYRQFVGPAVLAGKQIVSNEMGAVILEAYRSPLSHLQWQIHRALAAGVNRFVIHGQDYTGSYYGTTWPGYTAFAYLFANQFSEKDPVWYHGFADTLDYVARVQYTQQRAQLLTDVAIYNKISATNPNFPTIYTSSDLEEQGYTYNYLSPHNLALPQATVQKGRLAPAGPAYKAVVVPSTANLTYSALEAIQNYAQRGLPVILSGGDPHFYPTAAGVPVATMQAALVALKKSPNVYSVPAGGVAKQLLALQVLPDVQVRANGTWYPVWRRDDETGTNYCLVFNDNGNFTTGVIEVSTTQTPYLLDAWSGSQAPLLQYEVLDNRTRIPLRLQAHEMLLLSFQPPSAKDAPSQPLHATQLPSVVIGSKRHTANSSALQLHVIAGEWDAPARLSNGRIINRTAVAVAPSIALSNWTLTAEHWEAPGNITGENAATIAVKRNTTHHLQELISWAKIPALQNVSGVGYYATNFTWPLSSGNSLVADGVYLRLPPIDHAARVIVNGQRVPPVNPAAPMVDITEFLRLGKANTLLVEVPALMWNYLRSIIDELTFMEVPADFLLEVLGGVPGLVDNGLLGEAALVPYSVLTV